MEFIGKIAKFLPQRSGVSQRTGNEWKSQPFVFEYFENPSDRYPDSVVLETYDERVIPYLREGMEIRCGFGHRVREYNGNTYNDLRLYKLESVKRPAANATGQAAQQQTAQQPPIQPITQAQDTTAQQPGEGKSDDLPF